MPIPDILTLDFDGVLCDGMQEYFEASRRTYMRIWPDEPAPGEELFPAFRDLRPVIMTGWEMPLLLRALAQGHPPGAMLQHWEAVRDELMQVGAPQGKALSEALTHTLDEVRRAWIATTPGDWLTRNIPDCPLDDVRRLLAEPESAVLVTTKEGEFARQILTIGVYPWLAFRARRPARISVTTCAPSWPRTRRYTGDAPPCGLSRTAWRPCNTSPPTPTWTTLACSWPPGATTRRTYGRQCRTTGVSVSSPSHSFRVVVPPGSETLLPHLRCRRVYRAIMAHIHEGTHR